MKHVEQLGGGYRSTVIGLEDRIVKIHHGSRLHHNEVRFYTEFPEFCPKLLGHTEQVLVIERCIPAADIPDWQPVDELASMLERMGNAGVHHRDLYIDHVVRDSNGDVKLIDWEWAIRDETKTISYDLHGPDRSGVPSVNNDGLVWVMWWGNNNPKAIGTIWGRSGA